MMQPETWGDVTAPDPTETVPLPAELMVAHEIPRLTPSDICTLLMVIFCVCSPLIAAVVARVTLPVLLR